MDPRRMLICYDLEGGASGGAAAAAAPVSPSTPAEAATPPTAAAQEGTPAPEVTPVPATPAEPAAQAAGEPYTPYNYQAQAKGDFKTDPYFKDVPGITELMEGYKSRGEELERLKNSPEGTAAEAITSGADYKMLDNTKLDGVNFSDKETKGLQDIALSAGLSQEQFEKFVEKSVVQKKAAAEFKVKRHEATTEMLHKTWPSEAEYNEGMTNFKTAVSGLEKIGVNGLDSLFKNPIYGDNAVLIKMVSTFGPFFQNDNLAEGNLHIGSGQPSGILSYPSMKK